VPMNISSGSFGPVYQAKYSVPGHDLVDNDTGETCIPAGPVPGPEQLCFGATGDGILDDSFELASIVVTLYEVAP